MDKKSNKSLFLLRAVLLVMVVLSLLASWRIWQVMKMLGIVTFPLKWVLILIAIGFVALVIAILFSLTWNEKYRWGVDYILAKIPQSRGVKTISCVLFVFMITFYTWLFTFSPAKGIFAGNDTLTMVWSGRSNYLVDLNAVYPILEYQGSTGNNFISLQSGYFQWWMFGILGLAAALTLKMGWKKLSIGTAFLAGFIGEAVVYKTTIILQGVSSNPFALSWQESYRLYYASLLASERLYGMSLPLSMVDFSLNIMNGIPFILGDIPIWAYRLWQVALTLGLAALTGWALVRRLKLESRLWRWLTVGFVLLYLLQEGGVKYNLLMCVLIVLFGFSSRHPWHTLVSVVLASFWAGLSRVNWFPVPAMLGVALYLLEESAKGYRSLARYLYWPALWTITGIAAAFLANQVMPLLSGSNPFEFESIFDSRLLWYRLLPNPTYSLGVLLAVFLVSLPLWWICLCAIGRWHPIRWIGLMVMLMVLFAGGLVVSIKIGGGGDLHNMDAYFVMMGAMAAYIFFQRYKPDYEIGVMSVPSLIVGLALIFPIWSAVKTIQPYKSYDHHRVEAALQTLKNEVEQASESGEVLFMYQKQLLTFGYVDVPLTPGYENVYVLEMAMSHNDAYLTSFYDDLCKHRFSMIVSEVNRNRLLGSAYGFGEENDVWFTFVTLPLLQTYQLNNRIPEGGLELYVPRLNAGNCNISLP